MSWMKEKDSSNNFFFFIKLMSFAWWWSNKRLKHLSCSFLDYGSFFSRRNLSIEQMHYKHWLVAQAYLGKRRGSNANKSSELTWTRPNQVYASRYYPFKMYVESETFFFQFAVQAWCNLSPCLNDHSYSWVVYLLQLVFEQAGSKQKCRNYMP